MLHGWARSTDLQVFRAGFLAISGAQMSLEAVPRSESFRRQLPEPRAPLVNIGSTSNARATLAHTSRVNTLRGLTASLAQEIKQPIGAAVTNAETCLRLLNRDQPDQPEAREAALEMARDLEVQPISSSTSAPGTEGFFTPGDN
jgi:hypothetical protein